MNRKKENQEMIDKVFEKETERSEEITNLIIEFYNDEKNNTDEKWNELYKDIVSIMKISLVQTYKITIQEASKIYDFFPRENISHIKYKDVKPYIYTEDGLTLEKRVLKHIKIAKNKDFNKVNRNALISKEIKILDTETMGVNQRLIYQKMKKLQAVYVCLNPGGGCDRACCNTGINEWMPIAEVPSSPPYHSNCQCFLTYDEDDPEELEDIEE